MSITDELRAYVKTNRIDWGMNQHVQSILVIADRIDKEHAEAVADALQLRGEPDRWVELPADADGVPIHVGDELTYGENFPAKVCGMVLDESGWMVSTRELRGYGVLPATLRHVQPDTWERIIQDAISEGFERTDVSAPYEVETDVLIERCKRLAGERG